MQHKGNSIHQLGKLGFNTLTRSLGKAIGLISIVTAGLIYTFYSIFNPCCVTSARRLVPDVPATAMPKLDKPEGWAHRPEVQSTLARLLQQPNDDHSDAVRAILPDRLRDVHAYSLSRLPNSVTLGKGAFEFSLTRNVSVALHTWLYHSLGGASAQLRPLPAADDPAGIARSVALRIQCGRTGERYEKEVARLEKAIKRGTAEPDELQSLRDGRVRDDWLRDGAADGAGACDAAADNKRARWQARRRRAARAAARQSGRG